MEVESTLFVDENCHPRGHFPLDYVYIYIYGGCPIFLFIETAILREKNINIRETFANPVVFFRGGSPCHETI